MFVVCDLAKNPVNRYPLTDRKEYPVVDETLTEFMIQNDLGKLAWYSKSLFFEVASFDPSERVQVDPMNRLSNLICMYEERSSHYNKFGNFARSRELQLVIQDLRQLAKLMMTELESNIRNFTQNPQIEKE